jgi:tetratricopeptide (TPR) repeat protein
MGQLDEALIKFDEGTRLSIDINGRMIESSNLAAQGRVLYKKNRVDEALPLVRRSLEIGEEIGDLRCVHESLGVLALVLAKNGDKTGALEALDRKEKICREKGFRIELQECLEQRKLIINDTVNDHG